MDTLESIEDNQDDYHEGPWKTYSNLELGRLVHNLLKRAMHRKNAEKKAKDIKDARVYLDMLTRHVELAEYTAGIPHPVSERELKLEKAVALLNSMVAGGEQHSDRSRALIRAALGKE